MNNTIKKQVYKQISNQSFLLIGQHLHQTERQSISNKCINQISDILRLTRRNQIFIATHSRLVELLTSKKR